MNGVVGCHNFALLLLVRYSDDVSKGKHRTQTASFVPRIQSIYHGAIPGRPCWRPTFLEGQLIVKGILGLCKGWARNYCDALLARWKQEGSFCTVIPLAGCREMTAGLFGRRLFHPPACFDGVLPNIAWRRPYKKMTGSLKINPCGASTPSQIWGEHCRTVYFCAEGIFPR